MNLSYKKLSEVCEILDSRRIPITASERRAGPYPYYGANGIQDYVDNFIFDDELVLLAEDGGNFGSKDRPIAYRVSGKCWVNNHAHVLKPLSEIDVDYLCYSLMFYDTSKFVNGATRQKLTQAAMRQMSIPIRSLSEQKEIVCKIKSLGNIMALRKSQLKKLDCLASSRFIEMFGDPVKNPKGWEIHSLSDYIEFLTSGSRGWSQYFSDTGAYFITIKNVKGGKIIFDDVQFVSPPNNAEAVRTKIQEGDLLISITADLGRTAVVSREVAEYGGYINQHLSCIRLNRNYLEPFFVANFLESDAGKRQFAAKNQNAVKAGLNFNSIRSLRIPVPPLSLQRDFIAFIEELDKSKLAAQKFEVAA